MQRGRDDEPCKSRHDAAGQRDGCHSNAGSIVSVATGVLTQSMPMPRSDRWTTASCALPNSIPLTPIARPHAKRGAGLPGGQRRRHSDGTRRLQVVYPVCSLDLLDGRFPLRDPKDHHVLIRSGSSFLFEDAWPFWLRAAGVPGLETGRDQLTFEYSLPALDAAACGLGVAFGRINSLTTISDRGVSFVRSLRSRRQAWGTYYLVLPLELAPRP
jgi:hypothetical protein